MNYPKEPRQRNPHLLKMAQGEACHIWLDIGAAPRAEKELTFSLGLNRQIKAWEDIAGDEKQPERDRRAAAWALERIAT